MNSSETRELNKKNKYIYYLLMPKKEIYNKLIKEKDIKISLSTFYKMCDKNIKKPIKKTDLCPICTNGQKIKRKTNNRMSEIEKRNILEEIELYEKHLKLSEHQRKMFNEQKSNLTSFDCIVLMDFKQNIKIGGSLNETSRDFYNKSELSVLGFCIIYKQDDQIKRKFYNFVSENLSHDSFFVKKAINWLLKEEKLSDFWRVKFWSDCENHFRSKELIHYITQEIFVELFFSDIEFNFFSEYHGKNDVDGNFGVISRWLKDGENVIEIRDIDQLINYFNEKADSEDQEQKYYFIKFCPGQRDSTHKK